MNAWLLTHEPMAKLAELSVLMVVLWLAQHAWPQRGDGRSWRRWSTNIGLIAVSTLLLRWVFPISGTGLALWMQGAGIGPFGRLPWGTIPELVATVLLLDLAIYWQHRAFHRFPLLWRAHRVHHSDVAFDVSLGVRFHPFEILPSMAYKLAVVAMLGAAPIAVLIYELTLLGFSLLTHADVALSPAWDRRLRRVFVTPDWHRVHHSVYRDETDSNYGDLLSVWDRLFGTYIAQPRDGHRQMRIGLPDFRSAGDQTLASLLRQPFRRAETPTTLSREHPHA